MVNYLLSTHVVNCRGHRKAFWEGYRNVLWGLEVCGSRGGVGFMRPENGKWGSRGEERWGSAGMLDPSVMVPVAIENVVGGNHGRGGGVSYRTLRDT